uniref:Torsin n=1 Tax=Panagrolaimus sp. PS1159 TaxID=55785 RepID=A0AC35GH91_9BILA
MKLCTICILLMCFVFPVASEILSIIAGSSLVAGLGAGLGYFGWQKCFFDCCSEFKPVYVIEQNLTTLFAEQLYGQHIAVPAIKNAIINHLKTKEPRKALTLALHGITGTGKNYVASMIARSMFTKGMRSRNVHVINGNRHFYDEKEIHDFKNGLIHWIQGNLTSCSHSLFIFDEVDKLPSQVIDAIKPFIDHNIKITNADPRHSIFMFLSNTGSEVISQHALKYVQQGKARESISFIEMQEIVEASAYNQGEGGLKNSEIIGKHLIDYFIPFLPLTRTHVLLCIRDYAKQEGIYLTPEQEEKIAEGLTYFPRTSGSHAGVFSSSGCKHVANRVNLEKFQF